MALPRPPERDAPAARRHVVAMSWRNFINHFRDAWEPGQHVAMIGPTGEGKTTAALGILQLRKWVIALDAKGEDDTLSASDYQRISEWPPPSRIRDRIAEGHPARLIVGGPARTDEEIRRLGETLSDAVAGVRREGGWCLYCDEFQVLADRRMYAVTTAIEQLLITARTRGTSVLTAFQAPAWVPKAATRQASYIFVWGTHDEDSVKAIATAMGRPWHELQAMLQEIPEYHLLVIPKRFREPLILTHPPAVN